MDELARQRTLGLRAILVRVVDDQCTVDREARERRPDTRRHQTTTLGGHPVSGGTYVLTEIHSGRDGEVSNLTRLLLCDPHRIRCNREAHSWPALQLLRDPRQDRITLAVLRRRADQRERRLMFRAAQYVDDRRE